MGGGGGGGGGGAPDSRDVFDLMHCRSRGGEKDGNGEGGREEGTNGPWRATAVCVGGLHPQQILRQKRWLLNIPSTYVSLYMGMQGLSTLHVEGLNVAYIYVQRGTKKLQHRQHIDAQQTNNNKLLSKLKKHLLPGSPRR